MPLSISEPVSGSEPSPHGSTIRIKRLGAIVQISLQCSDEYQAIEVYDRLVEAAKSGKVRLDLNMINCAPVRLVRRSARR